MGSRGAKGEDRADGDITEKGDGVNVTDLAEAGGEERERWHQPWDELGARGPMMLVGHSGGTEGLVLLGPLRLLLSLFFSFTFVLFMASGILSAFRSTSRIRWSLQDLGPSAGGHLLPMLDLIIGQCGPPQLTPTYGW